MEAKRFPGVHWIWEGAISFVYEVHPRIAVKVPRVGEEDRERFQKELKIYEIFSQHSPCPSIVQAFLLTENGVFLEYMRDESLYSRLQDNIIRDQQTSLVTKVKMLEPLQLRMEWMNDLTHGVAFLESLNLAHGDLRPENILLDRNRLKLSDFDCTATIGSDFEACLAPYGRFLNDNDSDQGRRGTSGFLGPRTEQFALGSLFYLINYGLEVYGDQRLTEDLKERGPKFVDLLQDMKFPALNGDPRIDSIIHKCWHNQYASIAELASCTKALLSDNCTENDAIIEDISISKHTTCDSDQDLLGEDLASTKTFCQDLEKRGLLELLSSGEPKELGFPFEWYRHARKN